MLAPGAPLPPVPGKKKETGLNRVNKNEVYNKSK